MFFGKKVGIDLGTANTLVYLGGEGIVLNEPTVVSYSLEDRKILAVGDEAREMLGRTPGSIVASRPMKEGVIADYTTTCAMITYFLKKALKNHVYWPELMISIPVSLNPARYASSMFGSVVLWNVNHEERY